LNDYSRPSGAISGVFFIYHFDVIELFFILFSKININYHTMNTLHFQAQIKASANAVYRNMLGLDDKQTYERWTAAFNAGSTYKGSWRQGNRIFFIGFNEDGSRGGMISEIASLDPARFVSIRHVGVLEGDQEIYEGPHVEKWAGGLENYYFEEHDGITTLRIETDTTDEYVAYFNDVYPQALNVLKNICEQG